MQLILCKFYKMAISLGTFIWAAYGILVEIDILLYWGSINGDTFCSKIYLKFMNISQKYLVFFF